MCENYTPECCYRLETGFIVKECHKPGLVSFSVNRKKLSKYTDKLPVNLIGRFFACEEHSTIVLLQLKEHLNDFIEELKKRGVVEDGSDK